MLIITCVEVTFHFNLTPSTGCMAGKHVAAAVALHACDGGSAVFPVKDSLQRWK